MSEGVSVVVCCYNSAERLPRTLGHLAAQHVRDGLQWEVIVVDNASTDDTSRVALTCWPAAAPAPLHVVREPRLGLSYARRRGFGEAKYEIISFVDDDNWVCSEWVQFTSEVMGQQSDVGACGGLTEALCEVTPPWWFERYKDDYAIGAQAQEPGDITWTRGWLWGAGLSVRKSAWQQLVSDGFRFSLTGRQGSGLGAGEEVELCYALRSAEWRLWYDPRLQLRHFLPAHRLKWSYLRSLHRGFGAATVGYDPYYFALKQKPSTLKESQEYTWQWQVLAALRSLYRYRRKMRLWFRQPMEGDTDALYIEDLVGRLIELLRRRRLYDLKIREVRDTSWNQTSSNRPRDSA